MFGFPTWLVLVISLLIRELFRSVPQLIRWYSGRDKDQRAVNRFCEKFPTLGNLAALVQLQDLFLGGKYTRVLFLSALETDPSLRREMRGLFTRVGDTNAAGEYDAAIRVLTALGDNYAARDIIGLQAFLTDLVRVMGTGQCWIRGYDSATVADIASSLDLSSRIQMYAYGLVYGSGECKKNSSSKLNSHRDLGQISPADFRAIALTSLISPMDPTSGQELRDFVLLHAPQAAANAIITDLCWNPGREIAVISSVIQHWSSAVESLVELLRSGKHHELRRWLLDLPAGQGPTFDSFRERLKT
jgi:hypothetical protein